MFKVIDGKVRFEYDESKVFIDLDDVKSQKINVGDYISVNSAGTSYMSPPTVSDGYASKVISGVGLSYDGHRMI